MAEVKLLIKKVVAKVKNGLKVSRTSASNKKTNTSPSFIAMTVIGILLCIVLIPIFVVNVTLTIKGTANKDKVPTVFGVAPLIVFTGSMQPKIDEGDLIFINDIDVNDLQVGDVIAYKVVSNNKGDWDVVTHRIVRLEEQNGKIVYRTKGDYNLGEDIIPVQQQDVIGIYRGARVAKLGKFMLFMQEPLGMVLFIGIPVVLFIGLDVLRRYLYSRKHAAVPMGDTVAALASKEEELEAIKAELQRLKSLQSEVLHTDNADTSSQTEVNSLSSAEEEHKD